MPDSISLILASAFGALSACLCLILLMCIPFIKKGYERCYIEHSLKRKNENIHDDGGTCDYDDSRLTIQEEEPPSRPELRFLTNDFPSSEEDENNITI